MPLAKSSQGKRHIQDGYDLEINANLINNIERFVPIDSNNKSNAKYYKLSKNGISTGVFNAKEDNNNLIRIQIQHNNNGNNRN